MSILKSITRLIDFIISCFIRGVLSFTPFLLTFYVVSWIFNFSKQILSLGLNNYWIICFLLIIMLCGYFTKNIIVGFFYKLMDIIMLRIPGVSFIYSSFKDLTDAFIDKKINFDKPVLINVNVSVGDSDIKKIGFITNENLNIGDNDEVAVFVPQSFSLLVSGEIYLVPRSNLKELSPEEAKQLLKFVVSGGFIGQKKNN